MKLTQMKWPPKNCSRYLTTDSYCLRANGSLCLKVQSKGVFYRSSVAISQRWSSRLLSFHLFVASLRDGGRGGQIDERVIVTAAVAVGSPPCRHSSGQEEYLFTQICEATVGYVVDNMMQTLFLLNIIRLPTFCPPP